MSEPKAKACEDPESASRSKVPELFDKENAPQLSPSLSPALFPLLVSGS